MQRSTTAALGLLLVLGVILAALLGHGGRSARDAAEAPPSASASPVASVPPKASAEPEEPAERQATHGGYDTLPDGGAIPTLPDSAPKEVKFGVVLFSYEGAQGAPTGARSRKDALSRATSVLDLARKDFAAAVAKGDRGSTSDAGRIPRGFLEPSIEYVLFTLKKDEIHPEPIDTPRGYWVVRRNQ